MEYCGNCGEPSEGRYCRMCGTPLSTESTQAMAAVPAGVAFGYEPTPSVGPTPNVGPLPMAMTQPPSEFDSLFRTPDGAPGLHGQTQVLPPMVETDYRLRPPGGGQFPPDPYDDDEERSSRPVLFATVGAAVVAAAVILGLLYLGNQNNGGSGTAAGNAMRTGTATSSASASQAQGVVAVPTQSAVATSAAATTASSSAAAVATTSAAGQFQGDSLPLGVGSQGSLVTWVQERLAYLGYYQGSVDGTFDQATALAVQQFQAAEGVTGDPASTVGPHTRLALVAAGSSPSLQPGDRSNDVARLNQALDYAEGANLSGSRYTMTTAAAVAFYQQAVGISPSGAMDAATWAKLQTGTLAGSTFSGGSQG